MGISSIGTSVLNHAMQITAEFQYSIALYVITDKTREG